MLRARGLGYNEPTTATTIHRLRSLYSLFPLHARRASRLAHVARCEQPGRAQCSNGHTPITHRPLRLAPIRATYIYHTPGTTPPANPQYGQSSMVRLDYRSEKLGVTQKSRNPMDRIRIQIGQQYLSLQSLARSMVLRKLLRLPRLKPRSLPIMVPRLNFGTVAESKRKQCSTPDIIL